MNMILKPAKTRFFSYKAGDLADGCKMCVKGEKLVLFVTGLCSQRCEFCPVSDRKLFKDTVYANERPVDSDDLDAIIEEATISDAKGAGVTGGDPLMKTKRTAGYIRLLKKRFGRRFHIHLYTPLSLVNESRLKELYEAGLDEIRFHPQLDNGRQWNRILLARRFGWKIGVEIPVLPGKEKEIKALIRFIHGKVDFLNLNELELADNSVWRAAEKKKAITTKDSLSYAIMGSDILARRLLCYAAKLGMRCHYCTCKLKDRVQLGKRVFRRAKQVLLPTDRMTDEGMLVRGAIYLPEFKPGFGYHDRILRLSTSERRKILKKLNLLRSHLIKELGVPAKKVFVDERKPRLLTSERIARMLAKKGMMSCECAAIVEYPTYDALELEVEYLR
jgi:uncharacterized protein